MRCWTSILQPVIDFQMLAHPYAMFEYARTLAHIGEPHYVHAWGTHVLARSWHGRAKDACGVYPLAALSTEEDLRPGIEELRAAGFVSIVMVVDPLLSPSSERLRQAFEQVRPFKTHYVVDTDAAVYQPSAHHRYEVRRSERTGLRVREVPLPTMLDAWIALYEVLGRRHANLGMASFSRSSFERLSHCDSLVAVAGFVDDRMVCCHLWFAAHGCAWSHLGASNAQGYDSGASYAVYDHSMRRFQGSVIDLGGPAGVNDAAGDGLARFKKGFANRTVVAHLVGSVLDGANYAKLCAEAGIEDDDSFFPAYRKPTLFLEARR